MPRSTGESYEHEVDIQISSNDRGREYRVTHKNCEERKEYEGEE